MKYNKRILILCEGLTEELYAKSLRNELPRKNKREIQIEVDYKPDYDPKRLFTTAQNFKKKAEKELNPYDEIWLFFDNDCSPHLKLAFDKIIQENFNIAYSSICIEHWFILHFENCGKAFTKPTQARKHLEKIWAKSLKISYHKTKIKHYQLLKSRLNDAIQRSITMSNNCLNDPIHKRNPYFTIADLITFFDSLKNKTEFKQDKEKIFNGK